MRLVYTAPIVKSPSKSFTSSLEWDPATSSLSLSLPDTAFPFIIAFGLGARIPEIKGSFFPSFKFGLGGEVEGSDSSDDEEKEGKKKIGFSLPGIGGKGSKKEKEPKKERDFKVIFPYRVGCLANINVDYCVDWLAFIFSQIPDIQNQLSVEEISLW